MKSGISTIACLIGLVLSLCGLFLPWGERTWKPWIMGPDDLLGIELMVGRIAFVGCIVTDVSLLYHILRDQRHSLIFALSGGLIMIFCSSTWIIDPGVLVFSSLPVYYKALYGTYVTLIGSVLVSANAAFNLLDH